MALSEQTICAHNVKRAELFAQHGLGEHDAQFAHPRFEAHAEEDVDCVLCGHRHIQWLFSLKFDVPDTTTMLGKIATGLVRTTEVTLQPVGSKCITDWIDALPESTERLAELKARWKIEVGRANAIKNRLAVERLVLAAGFASLEAAADAASSLPLEVRRAAHWEDIKCLKRNCHGIRSGACTPATAKKWLEILARCLALAAAATHGPTAASTAVAAAATPTAPAARNDLDHLSSDDAKLIRAGRRVFREQRDANLSERARDALIDIGRKVVQFGSFTPAQRRYFETILGWADNKPGAAPGPGEPGYTSPSGVAGARY